MSNNEQTRAIDVPVRPAATVMLVRDSDNGPEVFMLQRTLTAAFARGQYVFPGGKVDADDHGVSFEPITNGLDDAAASATMGLERGGLAWLVAAIRECFEEAGVLLARPIDGDDIVRFDSAETHARFTTARHAIHDGTGSLQDLCEAEGLALLPDRIHLFDHWITPVGERRRFDTRFFVAAAPTAQDPLHDDKETIASLWVRPSDAIAMWKAGELQMFPPTIASLAWLEQHQTAAAAVGAAEAAGIPPAILPRMVIDETGAVSGIVLPTDPGYDDVVLPEFVIGQPR